MNQDVVVTMDIALKPEAAEHFAQMDKTAFEGTRNFPGCRGVQIVRHKDDSSRFLFLERWETEQAYHDYIAWRTESGQLQGLQQMAVSITIDIWPQTVITV
jgi:quinol monooxygenase YgiN